MIQQQRNWLQINCSWKFNQSFRAHANFQLQHSDYTCLHNHRQRSLSLNWPGFLQWWQNIQLFSPCLSFLVLAHFIQFIICIPARADSQQNNDITISITIFVNNYIQLNPFVPSNSNWVASPSPSSFGAKRSKVGVWQEKPDKNAHISTVKTAQLPSLSDTMSLSSSLVYSESSTHPPSESSTLCSLSSSTKRISPLLQKKYFFD